MTSVIILRGDRQHGDHSLVVKLHSVEVVSRVQFPLVTHEILRRETTIKFQCPERSEGQPKIWTNKKAPPRK